ncbi:MAG TPA: substrate-binding domain-containing protein, partial [Gemmatimonadaceae bacterium]|nr:substrate-binding domain-containing protein [Gemmatimonadaceae bacterium]
MIKTVRSIAAALSAVALSSGVASAQSVDLTGAGATFPYPIYSKWFADYAQTSGVKINYQSIGSGGGIRQLSEQTVDFG